MEKKKSIKVYDSLALHNGDTIKNETNLYPSNGHISVSSPLNK